MSYIHEDIRPIQNFQSEEEELDYAIKMAENYFEKSSTAEFAIWIGEDSTEKYLFTRDVFFGVYAVYRLRERIR
jgi:hypothetical protein